jgi:hypothetical protein
MRLTIISDVICGDTQRKDNGAFDAKPPKVEKLASSRHQSTGFPRPNELMDDFAFRGL